MGGQNEAHPWMTPIRSMPSIQAQSSGVVSRALAARVTPALLTTMSTAAVWVCTEEAKLSMDSGSATSTTPNHNFAARSGQVAVNRLEARLVDVAQGQVGAPACCAAGDGLTNAAAGPGHGHPSAGQVGHVHTALRSSGAAGSHGLAE